MRLLLCFHENTERSKGGSVVTPHSLLSHGGRHGPTPIFSFLSRLQPYLAHVHHFQHVPCGRPSRRSCGRRCGRRPGGGRTGGRSGTSWRMRGAGGRCWTSYPPRMWEGGCRRGDDTVSDVSDAEVREWLETQEARAKGGAPGGNSHGSYQCVTSWRPQKRSTSLPSFLSFVFPCLHAPFPFVCNFSWCETHLLGTGLIGGQRGTWNGPPLTDSGQETDCTVTSL